MEIGRVEAFTTLLTQHGADLSGLRGSRGTIRCILPGHDDRTPSLSLDVDASLFHCFGCGEGGGLRRLRDLLSVAPTPSHERSFTASPPQPTRQAVRRREPAGARLGAKWLPWWRVNAYIRRSAVAVKQARAVATRLGPDDPRTWALLGRAVSVEGEGLALEVELDALAVGRFS